jgi:hypothetical protein
VLPSGRLTWNPKVPLPPGASVPLCDTLRAVTVCPLTVNTVFQEPTMAWPAGKVKVTVQPLIDAVPVLVTRAGSIT